VKRTGWEVLGLWYGGAAKAATAAGHYAALRLAESLQHSSADDHNHHDVNMQYSKSQGQRASIMLHSIRRPAARATKAATPAGALEHLSLRATSNLEASSNRS
jgi:hypothetical protein